MNFDGRVALIRGGTAGIGEATVRRVASFGAKTVFVGRNRRKGERIERELVRYGAEAVFFEADISSPADARRIVPYTMRTFGRLDYAFTMQGYRAAMDSWLIRPRKTSMKCFPSM